MGACKRSPAAFLGRLCHIPSPTMRDPGSVTGAMTEPPVTPPRPGTVPLWSISHKCGERVAQTGVGSSSFTGGNWGRRGRGVPQALLRNVLGESHWVSVSPGSPSSSTPARGHHPQGREEEEEECGQRSSSRVKSRGDGFQLSDVQGSFKALAGGVPRRWHSVTATGTCRGTCLVGRALLLPIGCWQPTTLQLPGAELG